LFQLVQFEDSNQSQPESNVKQKKNIVNHLIPVPDVVDYNSSGKKKAFNNPTFNPQKSPVRHFNVRTKLEFEKQKRKSLPAPEPQTADPLINFTDVLIPSKSSSQIIIKKSQGVSYL